MRKSEFRAWSRAFKRMEYSQGSQIVFPDPDIKSSTDFWIAYFKDKWRLIGFSGTVMEYTGLKAKNGKIYEEDIVKWGRYIGVIVWYKFAWIIKPKGWKNAWKSRNKNNPFYGYYLLNDALFDWNELKIIGNTIENPKLLEDGVTK